MEKIGNPELAGVFPGKESSVDRFGILVELLSNIVAGFRLSVLLRNGCPLEPLHRNGWSLLRVWQFCSLYIDEPHILNLSVCWLHPKAHWWGGFLNNCFWKHFCESYPATLNQYADLLNLKHLAVASWLVSKDRLRDSQDIAKSQRPYSFVPQHPQLVKPEGKHPCTAGQHSSYFFSLNTS